MFEFLVIDVFDDVTLAVFHLYSRNHATDTVFIGSFEVYVLNNLYVYLSLLLYLNFLCHPRVVKIAVEKTVKNSSGIKFKTKS